MRRSREIASAWLLAALALAACGPAAPTAIPQPAAALPAAQSAPTASPTPVRTAVPVNRKPAAARRTKPFTIKEWRAEAAAWLRRDPCAAPCWEGITPGVTTVEEALEQLRQSPLIDPDSVQVYQIDSSLAARDSFVIQWQWVGRDVLGFHILPGGEARVWQEPLPTPTPDPNPPAQPRFLDAMVETHPITPDRFLRPLPIASIEPHFSYHRQPAYHIPGRVRAATFTLGQVIEAYGEPSHVVATFDGRDSWSVALVFEQLGFVIETNNREAIRLDATLGIDGVTFTDDPIAAALFLSPPETLVPWQGMRDFAFYCRMEKTGAPCP
ncbi:MAG TPA: hypothetical protein VGE07_16785 [Herpetosiphonaceae bacterium]